MSHYHRHRNSGCGSVFLAFFLIAMIPASFATPGMWWIGVVLIAFFTLAILGAVGKHQARQQAVTARRAPRPSPTLTARHWTSKARRCGHCGAPSKPGAERCHYCSTSLLDADVEERTVRWGV